VQNDTITLSGVVSTLAQEDQAVNDANKIGEGYAIVNQLTVEPKTVANQALFDSVAAAIHKHVFYSIFDWVTIKANDGVVTLSGWVDQPWHRKQFLHAAEKVPGIKELVDSIQILPVSFLDDQIRHRAAELIYDSPTYEQYTYAFYPPIHIIVDHGVVTLYGVAATQNQKAWITNQIAINTQAFKVINKLGVPQS
jgi:hyperosmotically inducible protein